MSSRHVVDLRGAKPKPRVRAATPAPRGPVHRGRPTPLHRRRRRTRLVLVCIALAVLGGLVYGVHWVSYQPAFRIQKIDVHGARAVPADAITAYVDGILHNGTNHFIARDDIAVYPRAVIARDLAVDFPRISSAAVDRDSLFGTTLNITVVERAPYARWCESVTASSSIAASGCYEMDEGGFIFAEAAQTTNFASAYVFGGGVADQPIGQTFAPGHLPGIRALLDAYTVAGFHPLGATIEDGEDFWVPFAEGFFVKASYGENPDTLVANLKLVLNSDALKDKEADIEYVDLRFGDRVYYKMHGAEEVQQ